MQWRFVQHLTEGLNKAAAAEAAGYANPDVAACKLLQLPHVVRAIGAEVARHLVAEAAPIAYNVLLSIAKNEKASDRVRVDAAKTLLDRAGFVPPRAAENDGALEKPLNEMTADELRAVIAQAETRLANEAKPVNAQDNAQHDPLFD